MRHRHDQLGASRRACSSLAKLLVILGCGALLVCGASFGAAPREPRANPDPLWRAFPLNPRSGKAQPRVLPKKHASTSAAPAPKPARAKAPAAKAPAAKAPAAKAPPAKPVRRAQPPPVAKSKPQKPPEVSPPSAQGATGSKRPAPSATPSPAPRRDARVAATRAEPGSSAWGTALSILGLGILGIGLLLMLLGARPAAAGMAGTGGMPLRRPAFARRRARPQRPIAEASTAAPGAAEPAVRTKPRRARRAGGNAFPRILRAVYRAPLAFATTLGGAAKAGLFGLARTIKRGVSAVGLLARMLGRGGSAAVRSLASALVAVSALRPGSRLLSALGRRVGAVRMPRARLPRPHVPRLPRPHVPRLRRDVGPVGWDDWGLRRHRRREVLTYLAVAVGALAIGLVVPLLLG